VLENEEDMISDIVYKSDKFNYEIAIPMGVVIEEKENEMGGEGVVLFRNNSEVLFSIDIPGSGQKYIKHSDDKAIQRQEILKGKQVTVIKAPSGECDGQGCNGIPFVSYVIEDGGQYYTLTFYNKIALTNRDQQILESFRTGEALKDNYQQKSGNLNGQLPFSFAGMEKYDIVPREFNIIKEFSADKLFQQAKDCGVDKSLNYFKTLLRKFSPSDTGNVYVIKPIDQKSNTNFKGLKIKVIPNKLQYDSLDDFKKDFNLCEAGGDSYPAGLSKQYLLFKSSCSTGVSVNKVYDKFCNTMEHMKISLNR